MFTNLCKISSLNNLGKKGPGPFFKKGGQIATILIVMMVAVLIFILVTVNVGRTSTYATTLANAADAAALSLGSQLATHGYVLREGLKTGADDSDGEYSEDPPQVCKRGGWMVWLLAPIDPVVGGYLGGRYQGTGGRQGVRQSLKLNNTVVCSAAAGFVAGGVYGAIAGAILGAIVATYNYHMEQRLSEHAISEASEQLSQLSDKDAAREDVFYQVLLKTVDDPNEIADYFDSDADGDTEELVPYFQYWWDRRMEKYVEVTEQLTQAVENLINGPLSSLEDAADTFLGTLDRQETKGVDGSIVELARALEQAGYALSFYEIGASLEEDDEYLDEVEALSAELTVFAALVETIKGKDIDDLVSRWETWVKMLYDPETTWTPDNDEVNADYYDVFENYIEPELADWEDEIAELRDSLPDSELSYKGGKVVISNSPPPTKIYQARADEFKSELENINYFLSHWGWGMFGISRCGTCYGLTITGIGLSNGVISYAYKYYYTYEERIVIGYEEIVIIEEGQPPITERVPITELVTRTKTVTGSGSYDIDSYPAGSGLYIRKDTLGYFTNGVNAFENFLDRIELPFATIDGDTGDEFALVLAELENFIATTQDFLSEIAGFYHDMHSIEEANLSGSGGKNPITYTWTDSLGKHSIVVQVSGYDFAWVRREKTKKHGGLKKKTCLILMDYKDDCWVKVTRKDPANKDLGLLGKWNPTTSKSFNISRMSRVKYSYDKVKVSGRR